MSKYELSIEDADGPIQLCLLKGSSGMRLLGSKGSPYKKQIKKWFLDEKQMEQLISDIQKVMDQD